MHSRDYRSVKQLADKRVVVVGSGNSACDIVVDATSVAQRDLSKLPPRHLLRAEIHVRPADRWDRQFLREAAPAAGGLRNRLYTHWHQLMVGTNARYGLPEPEHRIMDTHPTMNTVLPQLAAHGRIGVKPDITEFAGAWSASPTAARSRLIFSSTPPATRSRIPFLDNDLLLDADKRPLPILPRLPSAIRRSLRRGPDPGQWQHLAYRGRPVEARRQLLIASPRATSAPAGSAPLKLKARKLGGRHLRQERAASPGNQLLRLSARSAAAASRLRPDGHCRLQALAAGLSPPGLATGEGDGADVVTLRAHGLALNLADGAGRLAEGLWLRPPAFSFGSGSGT